MIRKTHGLDLGFCSGMLFGQWWLTLTCFIIYSQNSVGTF